MTTYHCRACGEESEKCYRCSECGSDLANKGTETDGGVVRTDGGHRPIPDHIIEWIEGLLAKCTMVQWDRFTVGPDLNNEGELYLSVYGWIDRDDDHEDFVVVKFWTVNREVEYTTSSAEYTEELYCLLIGETLEEHDECRRVENTFDISNSIKQHEQVTLTDGGEDLGPLSTHELVGKALKDHDDMAATDGIPTQDVADWVVSRTELKLADVMDAIEYLHNRGHIYEPRADHLRRTDAEDERWLTIAWHEQLTEARVSVSNALEPRYLAGRYNAETPDEVSELVLQGTKEVIRGDNGKLTLDDLDAAQEKLAEASSHTVVTDGGFDPANDTLLQKGGIQQRMRCKGPVAHNIEEAFVTVEKLVEAVESDEPLTDTDGIGPKTAEAIEDWWDNREEREERASSSTVKRTSNRSMSISFHQSWADALGIEVTDS